MHNSKQPITLGIFTDQNGYKTECKGLTKREHVATMAMLGYLGNKFANRDFDQIAEISVKQADALLAELEKTNSNE